MVIVISCGKMIEMCIICNDQWWQSDPIRFKYCNMITILFDDFAHMIISSQTKTKSSQWQVPPSFWKIARTRNSTPFFFQLPSTSSFLQNVPSCSLLLIIFCVPLKAWPTRRAPWFSAQKAKSSRSVPFLSFPLSLLCSTAACVMKDISRWDEVGAGSNWRGGIERVWANECVQMNWNVTVIWRTEGQWAHREDCHGHAAECWKDDFSEGWIQTPVRSDPD